MSTGRSIPDRLVGAIVAAASVLGAVLVLGFSIIAGLFLLLPMIFVGILLRTAVRHYFGRTEVPSEERI